MFGAAGFGGIDFDAAVFGAVVFGAVVLAATGFALAALRIGADLIPTTGLVALVDFVAVAAEAAAPLVGLTVFAALVARLAFGVGVFFFAGDGLLGLLVRDVLMVGVNC